MVCLYLAYWPYEHVAAQADSSLSYRRASLSWSLATDVSVDSRILFYPISKLREQGSKEKVDNPSTPFTDGSVFSQRQHRGHFVYAPSQWETTLQCNVVSHWLGAFTKWSLIMCSSWAGLILQTQTWPSDLHLKFQSHRLCDKTDNIVTCTLIMR